MTGAETDQRTHILDQVEHIARAQPTGVLPWSPEYTPWFPDRHALVAGLRERWHRHVAHHTHGLDEEAASRLRSRLESMHAPVLRILDRYDEEQAEATHPRQPWQDLAVPSPRAGGGSSTGARPFLPPAVCRAVFS